ncbi:hypothetical protein GCM10007416_08040 [Kroppenstedtia guangzhouensis]|uniref:Uncharacterized protein n=1 Tax=Kroppenstedtia guangzhouensis TaxID=1274356 RepID=A0ABQ1G654_9BACL|nr:hypothetical protein GCM10007416_08040 [Kroppenstedtia guangzhouensis]
MGVTFHPVVFFEIDEKTVRINPYTITQPPASVWRKAEIPHPRIHQFMLSIEVIGQCGDHIIDAIMFKMLARFHVIQ